MSEQEKHIIRAESVLETGPAFPVDASALNVPFVNGLIEWSEEARACLELDLPDELASDIEVNLEEVERSALIIAHEEAVRLANSFHFDVTVVREAQEILIKAAQAGRRWLVQQPLGGAALISAVRRCGGHISPGEVAKRLSDGSRRILFYFLKELESDAGQMCPVCGERPLCPVSVCDWYNEEGDSSEVGLCRACCADLFPKECPVECPKCHEIAPPPLPVDYLERRTRSASDPYTRGECVACGTTW